MLLAARDDHTTTSEIAELMGITKQAASKLTATVVAAGYLIHVAGDADGRQRPNGSAPSNSTAYARG